MPEYPPAVAELLTVEHPTSLGPGTPAADLRAKLATVCASVSPACAAGLWLRFDFFDESHAISQALDSAEGSFWHAILHRREPDGWNSKYWFRQVGAHPVLRSLVEKSPALGYRFTTAADFVDHCDRVRGTGTVDEGVAKRVQNLEWQLLFDHCLRAGLA